MIPGYQPSESRPADIESGKVGSLIMASVDRLLSLQTTPS
jgi:hypothetical protein